MIKVILAWFDAHVWAYWFLAWGSLGLNYAWAFSPAWRESSGAPPPTWTRGQDAAWVALVFLTLLAWRWPVLLNPGSLSPDESQLIAGALTLTHDANFWRAIDGGTAGPLDFYALLPLHWLGLPQDFFCARLTGLLLITTALVGIRRALRAFHGEPVASIGCLPVLSFFAFAMEPDFLHYSTEHMPFALFALAVGLLATVHTMPSTLPRRLIVWLGLVLGAMPWAKLQAAPLGAAVGVVAMVSLLIKVNVPLRQRFIHCTFLVAAALAPSAIAAALIVGSAQWTHFHNSYIAYNRHYVNTGLPLNYAIPYMWGHVMQNRVFPSFFVPGLLFAVIASVSAWRLKAPKAPLLAAAAFVAVALFVVAAPHRDFPHYALFLIVPVGLWAGTAFGALWNQAALPCHRRRTLLVVAGAMLAIPVINRAQQQAPSELGLLLEHWRNPISRVSRLVRTVTSEGDSLSVWGWAPHYHVETGLPQATRDGHTQRQIEESPLKPYYQQRYLQEMTRREPAVFIDAVTESSFGFTDGASFGHQSYAELGIFIRDRYVFVDTIEGVRVYLLSDRMAR